MSVGLNIVLNGPQHDKIKQIDEEDLIYLQECYAQNYTTESGYDYQDLGCISTKVRISNDFWESITPGSNTFMALDLKSNI